MRWAALGDTLDGEAKRASMNSDPTTVLGQQNEITPCQGQTNFNLMKSDLQAVTNPAHSGAAGGSAGH